MQRFTITHSDTSSFARNGILHLPHGDVCTPVFMPVGTNAAVKAMSKDDLEHIGFELILANTYHLYLRPGVDVVRQAGGLHGFSAWNKNFLTDSGGFQVFSLAPFRKITDEGVTFKSHIDGSTHILTPESVVSIQAAFNSDIQMQLDVCTGYGVSRGESEDALRVTNGWASRANKSWHKERESGYEGLFFPIVQGNFFEDLRAQSAENTSALDAPGIAIGGLSVGEPFDVYAHFLSYTARLLPRENPAT
jgi:queuine tRNA-ribosyltransferase